MRTVDYKPPDGGDDDLVDIFCRFRRDPRTGKVLDARAYGLEAWHFKVPRSKVRNPKLIREPRETKTKTKGETNRKKK